MNLLKKNYEIILLLILIIPICIINIGKNPIYQWDEARNSLNALEMYFNNNFIVTYYEGEPDLWNTKPPLLIWLQTISLHIFGLNEISIRIPSILATLLTCIYLYDFSKRNLKNRWISILIPLVLITINGYIEVHGTRTGDYDALLTLFTTIASLSLFNYCNDKKNKDLYLFFIALILAVLTKSIAALLFSPIYILLILFYKQLVPLIKNKDFYFGLSIFIIIVTLFYTIREFVSPGYIKAVLENELGGRFNSTVDNVETKETFFYWKNLFNDYNRLGDWLYLIPILLIFALFNKNTRTSELSIYLSILVIFHFFIITKAQTKYYWYDTPWFPLIALIIGLGIFSFLDIIKQYSLQLHYTFIAILFVFTTYNYYNILNKVYYNNSSEYDRNQSVLAFYFKDILEEKNKSINKNLIYCDSKKLFNTLFYKNILNKEKGYHIQLKDWNNLEKNDIVVLGHDDELKNNIESNYIVEILEHNQSDWDRWGTKIYKITYKK